MKKRFLFLGLLFFFCRSNAQTVAQTRCNNLGKGINLSNWLDAYWDPNWPVAGVYTKDFLVEMKSAGMKSVRLPVCLALITDTLPPYAVDTSSSVFQLMDSVFTWADELNMNVIIDNHNQWVLSDTTWRTVEPRLASLWSVLAKRYCYLDPARYSFEIMNEPANIQNDSLRLLFAPVIDTIRKYAPMHTIVVSPTSWSNGVGYSDWLPLADTNLMYTFHSYDPFPFTHQGFSWVNPPLPTGVVFPHPIFDALIYVNWGLSMQWMDSFKLPVFLGEFGVGINADDNSRCNWIDTIGGLIDYHHLSSFSWDVRGNFPLYKSGVVGHDSIIPCFSTALHLYENQQTAVSQIPDNSSIKIFPNPACETLSVVCSDGNSAQRLQLINSFGDLMLEIEIHQSTQINLANLSAGLYLVKIQNGQKFSTQRLIITK